VRWKTPIVAKAFSLTYDYAPLDQGKGAFNPVSLEFDPGTKGTATYWDGKCGTAFPADGWKRTRVECVCVGHESGRDIFDYKWFQDGELRARVRYITTGVTVLLEASQGEWLFDNVTVREMVEARE
jgi:hypothetical protein